MKWQSTAFVLLIGAVTAIAQSTPAAKNPPELSDAKFDATRLRTGRFEYRIARDGKQIAITGRVGFEDHALRIR